MNLPSLDPLKNTDTNAPQKGFAKPHNREFRYFRKPGWIETALIPIFLWPMIELSAYLYEDPYDIFQWWLVITAFFVFIWAGRLIVCVITWFMGRRVLTNGEFLRWLILPGSICLILFLGWLKVPLRIAVWYSQDDLTSLVEDVRSGKVKEGRTSRNVGLFHVYRIRILDRDSEAIRLAISREFLAEEIGLAYCPAEIKPPDGATHIYAQWYLYRKSVLFENWNLNFGF